MRTITVAIAGQDPRGMTACEQLLRDQDGITVLQGAGDTASAVLALKPRILLLALRERGQEQDALLQALRQSSPDTRVVLLADSPADDEDMVAALMHGARGYLEQSALDRHLVKAVRSVDQGEAWVPRRILGKVMDRMLH
ncbi:response regulator transcription factor [Noviherbaspirillum pedocola]|uniref:Response regulator transcription factor n=1 Tax=Noviherbaspirillum pedocola TaxID=2801341 RepID=A0A934SNR7_9BURK|nr:response regulator transcription factor [Noviherbaspirillum pedocola]MBK4733830.1 response regulator transcription factor [Noviherbaspirillum pedocola]